MGETGLWSPRGSHAKEPHALDLCSNQINLQRFDFKRRLLCGPNTTGRLGAPERTRCAFGGQTCSQHHPSRAENKGGSGHNEQQDLFPSIFLGLGTTVNKERSRHSRGHKARAIPSLLCCTEGTLLALTSLFSLCLFSLKG